MAVTSLSSLAELIIHSYDLEDDFISLEHIKRRVLYFRQLLIKREYDKTGRFNSSLIQAFDIKLTKTEKEDSRHYYESDVLPIPLLIKRKTPFESVSNVLNDRKKRVYGYITPEDLEYLEFRRFGKPDNYYTHENNRIRHLSKDTLRIRGVFENPLEVLNFAKQEGVKLNCVDANLESDCFYQDDLKIEETMAAAILTFFNKSDDRISETRKEPTG